ncbi:hypothetical protein [Actinomadura bangladeshensis]|uniref:Uncharacterized protein n=1 Tax=Actinomadura bangladeshensis TaxID=453573 RepID=A0A6L9QAZ5_9ACTN|nr:hypothetical protein [Actinomadura bangladeshensis]NEA22667.1 hypothetical protein [Actinomadura bangladeshensis]
MVTLPEPTDVQVATAHPEVAAYWAAAIAAGKAGYRAETMRRQMEECFRRVPDTKPNYREIREGARRRAADAATAHEKAVNAMAAAETAAHQVAPAATVRARLSMDAYSARLHQELTAHRRRRRGGA